MRLPLVLILPVLIVGILLDWYICRAVRTRCTRGARFWRPVSVWSSVIFALLLIVLIVWPKRSTDDSGLTAVMWILYTWFSVYISKAVYVFFDILSRIPQLWHGKRLKWLGRCGWISLAVFGLMWWGALVERFRIDVREVEIVRSDLPAAFDGLRIVQLSDIHLGTYGTDTSYVSRVVDAVNALHPDLIVFTGDIVNRRTKEMEPFVSTLSRLDAPMGVYSVLGNHDYGDYYNWPDNDRKIENMAQMYHLQQQAGWRMLNNNTEFFHRGADSLALIGVENIGDPPFHVYGNLDEAYPGDLADPAFKILLSHNPAHWENDIRNAPDKNIALTMSGHTHAMQMELFGLSPAALRYRDWGGLYADEDSTHMLYVNIGIGEVGIPARIGATPEVTLFTLKSR